MKGHHENPVSNVGGKKIEQFCPLKLYGNGDECCQFSNYSLNIFGLTFVLMCNCYNMWSLSSADAPREFLG